MKTLFHLMVRAVVVGFTVIHPRVEAAPVTGDVDFSGTAQFDTANVNTAASVQVWNASTVLSGTGTFTNLANGTPVTFPSVPWLFNSGPVSNFWSAGGFKFDLNASHIEIDGKGYLNILYTGTLRGNGCNATACTGTFSAVNIGGSGNTFSISLTFSAVPPPPRLRIVPNGPGSFKIFWPTNGMDPAYNYDFTLQKNTGLNPSNWVTSAYAITNGYGTNCCTVIPVTGSMYFRLVQ